MLNFLCAEGMGKGTIVMYVFLILILVVMLVLPYLSQRRKNREFNEMLSQIRVGDIVKTAGGVIGKITKITDKGEFKTVILETGSKTEKSYLEFDLGVIISVLKSTKAPDETKPGEAKTDEVQQTEEKVEAETVNNGEEVKTEAETETAESTGAETEVKEETETSQKPRKKRTSVTTSRKKKN